jgi:predicted acyltransferase
MISPSEIAVEAPVPPVSSPAKASARVRSVDALRGFDMFWILGAAALGRAFGKMGDNAVTRTLSSQLEHSQWVGVRFYDLIFPLFLFLIGVSIVFSLDKAIAHDRPAAVIGRIFRRSILLFLFGVFYSGGLSHRWPDIALGGVLQRIAACYLFAALIYYAFAARLKAIAGIAALLLVGYWALLTFVPFPDLQLKRPVVDELAARIGSNSPADLAAATPTRVHGTYEEGRNLTNYFDFRFLPGKKLQLYYINEGLLSTLPSIAICLFGIFAGRWLKDPEVDGRRKVLWLFAAGALAIGLGCLWGLQFPLIKRIWTSSFILVSGGYSAMMLGLFYWIVDVRKWDRWCEPFVWIGMNPITLYLIFNVFSFTQVAERLVGGDIKTWLNLWMQGLGDLMIVVTALGVVFLLAWFLHRHRIFLRV